MSSRIGWEDLVWDDPDGGKIVLHGTIPTVVYPRKLRPSVEWHGLALLESDEVVELWEQEEKLPNCSSASYSGSVSNFLRRRPFLFLFFPESAFLLLIRFSFEGFPALPHPLSQPLVMSHLLPSQEPPILLHALLAPILVVHVWPLGQGLVGFSISGGPFILCSNVTEKGFVLGSRG